MSFIDDDLAERKRLQHSAAELRSRELNISNASATIFEELWEELLGRIEEAETKDRDLPSILTNGLPYKRKLIVPQLVKRGESYPHPKEYTLALTKNHLGISLTGPETNVILPLDLCEDKVVRLKHEGNNLTIPEAAALLLRPLLFPDLYGPK